MQKLYGESLSVGTAAIINALPSLKSILLNEYIVFLRIKASSHTDLLDAKRTRTHNCFVRKC